jgi:multicomponent Na+:H+ antiporter subunit F
MFLDVIMLLLTLAALASASLIITGPSMSDRLLGLNLFSSKIIMMIVLYSLIADRSYYLDIALVFSLLGFIGIIFIGNFILRKGKI